MWKKMLLAQLKKNSKTLQLHQQYFGSILGDSITSARYDNEMTYFLQQSIDIPNHHIQMSFRLNCQKKAPKKFCFFVKRYQLKTEWSK